jgi:hypothetical protein
LLISDLRDAIRSVSSDRVVLAGRIPASSLAPGKYNLEISVTDRIANKAVSSSAEFRMLNP